MPDTRTGEAPRHFHPFAHHVHPDWHGHCKTVHRDHRGGRDTYVEHSCRRLHWHGPFFHRHTETGR